MNTTPSNNAHGRWSRLLIIAGSIGMLIGAVDPLEGSVLILPSSGLVALGTFLGPSEWRLITYRLLVFVLIVIGVGALWGLSSVGGIGGKSGHSMWWGVLVLPYLVGWSMGIWGTGSPRWVLLLGIVVGLWYLALLPMILAHPSGQAQATSVWIGVVIGLLGLLTIGGCIHRLRRPGRLAPTG